MGFPLWSVIVEKLTLPILPLQESAEEVGEVDEVCILQHVTWGVEVSVELWLQIVDI